LLSPHRVAWDPMLTVSDVVGHLDLLVDDGTVVETVDAEGRWRYAAA
jgi:hypothetical protein